jgi:hypothetical protein
MMFFKRQQRKVVCGNQKRPAAYEKLLRESRSPVEAQMLVKRLLADTLIARGTSNVKK